MNRKLAAILAADVAGYSALMERDEAGTHVRLKAGRKELFEPEIARHHGHIFKFMGDGMLAEFGSVVQAVQCAVALQRGLAERNEAVPEAERFQVRIGINFGEVIVEGKVCYGEGVNLAVRLQELAAPGGICVSDKVAKEVRKKLAFGFSPMGERKMKNIAEPVPVFRVQLGDDEPDEAAPVISKNPTRKIVLAGEHVAAIAVLPFDDMSPEKNLGYLGDGFAEDLITMLSRFPDLAVIARNSSFVYKGKSVDVRKVGAELGVDYVLEGSVRRSAHEIRITAQLVNTSDGRHVWAERFDKSGSDPLVLQDEATARVAATLGGDAGHIRRAQYQRAWGKDTASLGEYDYYLRGHDYLMLDTREGWDQGAAIFREGLVRFPASLLLKINLARYHHYYRAFHGFTDDLDADYRLGARLAREVLSAKPLTPQVARLTHWLMAYVHLQERNFAAAKAAAEQAIAIAPHDAYLSGMLATIFIMSGEPDRGIELVQKAMATDPANHITWHFRLGLAYSLKGEDEKSVAALVNCRQWADMTLLLAIGELRLGRLAEAEADTRRALSLDPAFTQAKWRQENFYSDPAILERQIADLARLGLPEK